MVNCSHTLSDGSTSKFSLARSYGQNRVLSSHVSANGSSGCRNARLTADSKRSRRTRTKMKRYFVSSIKYLTNADTK
jgi:hypothetical protein